MAEVGASGQPHVFTCLGPGLVLKMKINVDLCPILVAMCARVSCEDGFSMSCTVFGCFCSFVASEAGS